MNRRDLFRASTASALLAALPRIGDAAVPATAAPALASPAQGPIDVAFLLSDGAVLIDFTGPWEVFQNVMIPGRDDGPVFRLFTVAETTAPIKAGGSMTITPEYTFATAPPAQIVVIPAQGGPSPAAIAWIREAARTAALTMSVCTGAFVLAKTGLLSGRSVTTHHGSFKQFAMEYPDVHLARGARFVESGKFASAGGLSSGIDLALRVVERYFGRTVARNTANVLEYQGQGWLDPMSNRPYARRRTASGAHPLCPVCEMEVDKATAATSTYRRRTYYFCMAEHKTAFDAGPMGFLGG